MVWLGHFKRMPHEILIMFFVFLATPAISLSFTPWPWQVFETNGTLPGMVVTFTYWIFPLMICAAIIRFHLLFLPVYLLQCIALVVHSIMFGHHYPTDLLVARYLLVGFMAYIGIFFANKDLIYPFLSRENRAWRRSKRYQVSTQIQLIGDRPEHKIPAVVENISNDGLAIHIQKKHLQSFMTGKTTNDSIKVHARIHSKEFMIPVRIARSVITDEKQSLGLEATNKMLMKTLCIWAREQVQFQANLYGNTSPLGFSNIRDSAMTIWVMFILLSFGLPAFAASFIN